MLIIIIVNLCGWLVDFLLLLFALELKQGYQTYISIILIHIEQNKVIAGIKSVFPIFLFS